VPAGGGTPVVRRSINPVPASVVIMMVVTGALRSVRLVRAVRAVVVIRRAGSGHGQLRVPRDGPGVLWSQPSGLLQVAERLASLPPHGVRLREVDVISRLTLGREPLEIAANRSTPTP
jgi:hypothetical protein